MYCPGCGSEDRQNSQYCRACGADLRPVRLSIERPDSITASAVSAREDIGRAVAAKIREVEDARELKKVAEDVLPQIEKFLESPEEKRLRRVRAGTIVASSGLGTALLGIIMTAALHGPDQESAVLVVGLGAVAFAIGLALVLNGFLFTKPRKQLPESGIAPQTPRELPGVAQQQRGGHASALKAPNTAGFAEPRQVGSVTDHTTHLLNSEK